MYYYNSFGAITGQAYYTNSGLQIRYDYGDLSSAERQVLTINGLHYIFKDAYEFDETNGRLSTHLMQSTIGCSDTQEQRITYDYDDKGNVRDILVGDFRGQYEYDKLGRLSKTKTYAGFNLVAEEKYVYDTYQVSKTASAFCKGKSV